VIDDIGQFRFGEGDVAIKRLSAVSNANEFMQETGCAYLNVGYGAIVMRMNNVIKKATKDTISLKLVGTKKCI
jgi:hypothetical protein